MMSRTWALAAASVCVSILTGAVLVSHAGPLNPPAGSAASTYKTLAEVEPRIIINSVNTPGDADSLYKITQPGSYYLTQNITGVSSKHGIEVLADNVSIDLGGYSLLGSAGSFDGINTGATVKALSVRHGDASNWGGGSGVFAGNCTGGRFEDLTLNNNLREGLWPGTAAIVTRCAANGNGRHGFSIGDGCVVTECLADSNSATAFDLGNSAVLERCIARGNFLGVNVRNADTVRNNTITCAGPFSGMVGISITGSGARIEDNLVAALTTAASSTGIRTVGTTASNFVARNTVQGGFTTRYNVTGSTMYGPIITGATGDLSLVTGANHPLANFAN